MPFVIFVYSFSDDENSESDDEVSDDFYSMNDENSDTEMKSVIDDDMETMSMTSGASEAPIAADKYDLQFDVNEEHNILKKIKGLN